MNRQKQAGLPHWYGQTNFEEFYKLYEKSERVLFFVGSGPSIGAGFPKWRDLLDEIRERAKARRIHLAQDFEEKLNPEGYAEAGSILKNAFNRPNIRHTDWWREVLNDIFEKKKGPSLVHDALVRLRWNKIITTNYDRLIEEACERADPHIAFKVFHPWKKGLQKTLSTTEKVIFKIHGDIADKASQIVLTREEYVTLYDDPTDNSARFRKILESHLETSNVILFVGYSHDDPYFKEWFKKICSEKEAIPRTFALFPLPEEGEEVFNKKLEELRQYTGIRAIMYNAEGDHEEVHKFLQYLHDPRPIDALIKAKDFKKKPTVILLYTGGTIGSVKSTGDRYKVDTLSLRRISSRFDPQLEDFSKLILSKFRQFYHTGKDFQFDLIWEILPADQQILSENATPNHWNNLIAKINDILCKYNQGPDYVEGNELYFGKTAKRTDREEENELIKGQLLRIRKEEEAQFKERHSDGRLQDSDFVYDFKDRYIAGIVVLHGTDTLACSAAALAFGIRNLPLPIVLTGANRPPSDETLIEQSEFYSESDTWRNLVTSLYFLQCFGHRFTEVFVCFGDTIHHGLNLRKTAIDTFPSRRSIVPRQNAEPFTFRNYSIYKQYLFRLIDDFFCNNYYPTQLPYNELISPGFSYLRHVRQNPFRKESVPSTEFLELSPVVEFFQVSPSFPRVEVGKMLRNKKLRAVLIEGYKSGTYPTIETSAFAAFLINLHNAGIPIILVSHYGIIASQDRYETLELKGTDIQVLPLFGVIAETALPMLCRIVGEIDEKAWNDSSKTAGSLADYRRRLIVDTLRGLFDEKENHNIISIEFGDITDQNAKIAKRNERLDNEIDADRDRPGPSKASFSNFMTLLSGSKTRRRRSLSSQDSLVTIPRTDFLWHLGEAASPFERVGAGPDGFALLADRGFDWGFYGFHRYQQQQEPRTDDTLFFECRSVKRDRLILEANKILHHTVLTIRNSGIAIIERPESVKITCEPRNSEKHSSHSFSFEITVLRGSEFVRSDEKFTVQCYSEQERLFFTKLDAGPTSGQDSEAHFQELGQLYQELLENTWQQKTTSLDWFLLGAFKGVACATACYFLFDRWAKAYKTNQDSQHLRALRGSVKCNILVASTDVLRFNMTYYGWNDSD